ncbi:hypothetical protein ABZ128_35000 [Streptomyces sp. NPDC006326]|uniref:hypothetical protein n=1 Tax=Streptomyces sp. NPDC006326 TaxID=3156752 RepID=UPI0033BB9F70
MPATRSAQLMRAVAAAAVIAAAAPATAAYAFPSASVSPTVVSPGGRVSLNLSGCRSNVGRASSSAFGEARLGSGNLQSGTLFGATTVYRDASPGSYNVTFECGDGERVTVSLQVLSGAARGGLGGSTRAMNTAQIAVGGTLVAGAVGAGIWVLRRRARAS